MQERKSGVLPDYAINQAVRNGLITAAAAIESDQVQPASLDLRLGSQAFRIRASFLPGKRRTVDQMLNVDGTLLHHFALTEAGCVLETGCVYLVPLQEGLDLPPEITGRSNPKSSTGRIDVFTRVVTDYSAAFDEVIPDYSGGLWLEISPRTFPILVRPGDRLAQLRLKRGTLPVWREQIVSIDLNKPAGTPIGWRAKRHGGLIDLRGVRGHAVQAFWEPLYAEAGQLVLDPEEFYILASQENVEINANEAAEMAPIAPELGEFRAHYAGFFDPGFGTNAEGSRAVLEVRSRDVPFILEHGQPVAKLIFEQMIEPPSHLYGGPANNYQGQGLKLSKHFETDSYANTGAQGV